MIMLDKHLIARIAPMADPANIVCWKQYRVTVLQDRLFRIERNEERRYRDSATLCVWFRNMPPQDFSFEGGESEAVITTKARKLVLRESREDCYIEMDGKQIAISNQDNLLGTYRTLDRCNGGLFYEKYSSEPVGVPLENGVCSRSGVAVFDDADSVTLMENGEVSASSGEGSDEYVFAYGNDYREAVRALYMITGPVPMIPRYALGNWWSRYHAYTDKSYLRLLTNFEEHDVPLTVATLDMDWHYSKNIDEEFHITEQGLTDFFYGSTNGWTGYSWNKHLFPDYKSFLKKIKEKNLKITLNLHPSSGFRWWEDMYGDMAKAMEIDPETKQRIVFDITDPKFINAYFSIGHKPYEDDGVEFWWIDWQQGNKTSIEGLDPLWSLNHYHYLDNAKNHDVPMILSRYAGIGSHRYPLGFSGDTYITWETLQYLPYFTYTSSNVGYTWWSHDIGGHMYGEHNNELYLRHVQFGVFSPINRLHCCAELTATKEPWMYGNGCGDIAQSFLRFRHKMIPYLYSESYRTHKDGLALIEPLYYMWDQSEAYEDNHSYMLGGQFFVAPVVTPIESDGFARVKVWLPEGQWTDIFTGDEYSIEKGGERKTLCRDLTSIPVLAKAGSVLPLSADKGNSIENPEHLEVWVYNGNGEYSMYEDRGSLEALTVFTMREEGEKQLLKIVASGDAGVIPENRRLTVKFKNIPEGEVRLFADGAELTVEEMYLDCAALTFDFDMSKAYEIAVSAPARSEAQKRSDHARAVLLRAQGKTIPKHNLFLKLSKTESLEEYVAVAEEADISDAAKSRLVEPFYKNK